MPCSETTKKKVMGIILLSLHYSDISVLIITLCQNMFWAMFHPQWMPKHLYWWTTMERGHFQSEV